MRLLEEFRQQDMSHQMVLTERERMHVSGVTNIHSFDEQAVRLETTCGILNINGERLHMEGLQLETGDLYINGKVVGMQYIENTPRRSLLSRLFR